MKIIDLENWKRKTHYDFFSRMDYPQYNICYDTDITKLLKFTRQNNLSFYFSMIWLVTKTASEIEEFRYRKRGEKVVLHEQLHPSFTHINNIDGEDNLFKMIAVPMKEDLTEFVKDCKEIAGKQKEFMVENDYVDREGTRRDDYIYITSIPRISFTHISHTINMNSNDSVPRISWGKYFSEGDKIILPFSVQVNHAFVDGFHIGEFEELFQKNADRVCGNN